MDSSDGLGALSIFNEDLHRLILWDETLKDSLHGLASSSKQLLLQVLRSGMKLKLGLRGVKLAATWGEWLQQASGLHLQLDDSDISTAKDTAVVLALLLPGPNPGISALTVDLEVSVAHGTEALCCVPCQLPCPCFSYRYYRGRYDRYALE